MSIQRFLEQLALRHDRAGRQRARPLAEAVIWLYGERYHKQAAVA